MELLLMVGPGPLQRSPPILCDMEEGSAEKALRVQPRDTAVDGAPRHEDGGSWNGRRRRHGRCACFRRGLGNGRRGRLSGKAWRHYCRQQRLTSHACCTTAICRLPSWIALCALSRFFCNKVCIDFNFIVFFLPSDIYDCRGLEELVYSIDGICFFNSFFVY